MNTTHSATPKHGVKGVENVTIKLFDNGVQSMRRFKRISAIPSFTEKMTVSNFLFCITAHLFSFIACCYWRVDEREVIVD